MIFSISRIKKFLQHFLKLSKIKTYGINSKIIILQILVDLKNLCMKLYYLMTL